MALWRSFLEAVPEMLPITATIIATSRSTLTLSLRRKKPRRPRSPIASYAPSELHHCPTDNVSNSEKLDVLVELVECDGLDGVADLAVRRERHDFAHVGAIAPE